MKLKLLIGILVLFLLLGVSFLYLNYKKQKELAPTASSKNIVTAEKPTRDFERKSIDEAMRTKMLNKDYVYQGDLRDVTKGKVLDLDTMGQATGVVRAQFADNLYSLVATFSDLPDPPAHTFYEGWIVQKSPFKFISTGPIEKVNGVDTNFYTSSADLTNYDRYVLTIEPNDGNTAPAEHILEGDMVKK